MAVLPDSDPRVAARDTKIARARAERRKKSLPRLPPSYSIGRTDRGAAIPAWLERAPTPTEFVRRFALLVRRECRRLLVAAGATDRPEPVRPFGSRGRAASDIVGGREITVRFRGGLDPVALRVSLVATALARAVDYVARRLGAEFWSSRFREIHNVAANFRYFWGIRLTATVDALTPSQTGTGVHFAGKAQRGTAESISDYDSDPHGVPLSAFRKGALNRYYGFADNVAKLHPNEDALYARLYLFVTRPLSDRYKLFLTRAAAAGVTVTKRRKHARTKKSRK